MWKNLIQEFFGELSKQKLRSTLTLIAIAWGTLAVVLLLAFGRGLTTTMMEGMRGGGDQVIMIFGGQTSEEFQGLRSGRSINLAKEDAYLLHNSIPGIEYSSPQFGKGGTQLRTDKHTTNTYMEGISPDFDVMRTMYPQPGGRFINKKDVQEKRRVLFLGNEIAVDLFGDEDPIGNYVRVDGMPFRVIGVMQEKMQSSMNYGPDSRRAIIPYTTYETIYGSQYVNSLLVRPSDPALQPQIRDQINQILGSKYKFHPEDEQALGIWDFIEMERINRMVMTGIEIFLFAVGFFTLLIAGVGVANIMYVVVKERTREIGLKKAIGARKSHIISQFMFEATGISFLGGLIGLGISTAIIKGIHALNFAEDGAMEFLLNPVLSGTVMGVTFLILALIGLAAGIFPAIKAARLDPVESLRYE